MVSSCKQHNYTPYINYHKLAQNIKNNTLLLQDIQRFSEKHSVKMGKIQKKIQALYKKYMDKGHVKEKQLKIDNFLVIKLH